MFCAGSYLPVPGAKFPGTKAEVTPCSRAGLVPADKWDHSGLGDKQEQRDLGPGPGCPGSLRMGWEGGEPQLWGWD